MTTGLALESCCYFHRNTAQQLGVPNPNLRHYTELYKSSTEIVPKHVSAWLKLKIKVPLCR